MYEGTLFANSTPHSFGCYFVFPPPGGSIQGSLPTWLMFPDTGNGKIANRMGIRRVHLTLLIFSSRQESTGTIISAGRWDRRLDETCQHGSAPPIFTIKSDSATVMGVALSPARILCLLFVVNENFIHLTFNFIFLGTQTGKYTSHSRFAFTEKG